jgi:hypothetical protein
MSGANTTTSDYSAINVTIGDIILEGQSGPSGLRGLRILDVEGDKGPKIQVSYEANVTIRGGSIPRTWEPCGALLILIEQFTVKDRGF